MNLYANFVSVDGTKVTYSVGFSTKDITGLVEYDLETRKFNIIKQPTSGNLYVNAVAGLFSKYHNNFVNGVFPERISREIG